MMQENNGFPGTCIGKSHHEQELNLLLEASKHKILASLDVPQTDSASTCLENTGEKSNKHSTGSPHKTQIGINEQQPVGYFTE